MGLIQHAVEGAGTPAIVFVHGFACSREDWRAQVAHFAARHATVAVDLYGHGATPGSGADCTIESCGEDVAAVLRTRSLGPAVLVGHSLGCRVALEAARRAPGHVAGIVLVDGSKFAASMVQVFETQFAAGRYKALARSFFEQMFTPRSDAGVAAAVTERALALPESLGRALLVSLARYDVERLDEVLERTRKPLLVLQTTFTNDKRQRVPMRAGQTTPYLDLVSAKVPGVRIEVIPGVGHFPQLDAPAETNRLLESFFAALR
jgi:pimeloyl-ACP methyl ester carboxylesterase